MLDRRRLSKRSRPGIATALALTVTACATPTPPLPGWSVDTRPVSPAGEHAMAPNLHAGADGRTYLSWIEKRDAPDGSSTTATLRFATLDGDAWSPARTIASGDDWFVNWADFPSLAALADGTLLAHWLRKSGEATYAYDVIVSRSLDGGTRWSEPVVLHDDGTQSEHGFVSLVAGDDGAFHVAWLDGRMTGGGHGHGEGGAMTLRAARLDRDGTVRERRRLDGRVCDCCQTDAALVDGELLVAYRDRGEDERRDISIVRGTAGPTDLHRDGWIVPACPVNGPALSTAGDIVATAWFTAAGDEPRVLAAFSGDGGLSFGAPVRVDTGPTVGRVDALALEDGAALVSWIQDGAVLVRTIESTGAAALSLELGDSSDARAAGFPRLARRGADVVAAWTVPDPDAPPRIATAILRRTD